MTTQATLIDQPTSAPTRKLTAATVGGGTLGGAVAQLTIVGIEHLTGAPMDAATAGAVATLVVALVGLVSGWLVRERVPG
jgi:hypothetical protein